MLTVKELERLLEEAKAAEAAKEAQPDVQFRYAKQKVLNTMTLIMAGFSEQEAKEIALAEGRFLEGWALQYSVDGGPWVWLPPAKEIPRVE